MFTLRANPSSGAEPSLPDKSGHFRHTAAEIPGRADTELIFGDRVILVPECGADSCRGPSISHYDHVLAHQRSLNGTDGQFLSTVSRAANRKNTRHFVAKPETILPEGDTPVQEGLAQRGHVTEVHR